MVRTAAFDPIVVEPRLTPEKVAEVLGRGSESAKLDYKETYDPSPTEQKATLAKHVMAMANTAGGYIVFGVTDAGVLQGLSDEAADKLDEATIRGQVAGYTAAPLSIFLDNTIVRDGKRYGILTVLALSDTLAVAASDGAYSTGAGKTRTLFNRGDVLVRHGSASERWNQQDAEFLLARIARSQKDAWLKEFAADFGRLLALAGVAGPPAVGEASYDLPPADFQNIVTDLLRSGGGPGGTS